MKYQIETITKDEAVLFCEESRLYFKVYYSSFVDGEDDGAYWVLDSGVYYNGTDVEGGSDLEDFISEALYTELDASEAYIEMITDKSDYYYDLYIEGV